MRRSRRHDDGVKRSPAPRILAIAFALAMSACTAATRNTVQAPAPAERSTCVPVGSWVDPTSGQVLTTAALLPRLADKRVILLGEVHDSVEHHALQLQTLAALAAQRDEVVVGFEMLPRSAQSGLDRWVAGDLDETAFLEAVAWRSNWSLAPELYLPLFRFARLNRFPAVALNVDRSLVTRVGEIGWQALPADERAGLGDPAAPSDAYAEWLADVYRDHADDRSAPIDPTALQRFIDAQLLWDRAFAEGIAGALRQHPNALVAGIIGGGHVQHRWGVPHQLADLGITDVAVLLPWDRGADCDKLVPDIADAVFGLEQTGAVAQGPSLGIVIVPDERGVRVARVSENSIAAAAGIIDGDVILEAAGQPIEDVADMREIVARQAPGTWLPLRIARDDDEREIVARFPR